MTQSVGNSFIADRYRLESKLGEGGMGSVFRTYDRLTQQQVALKLVKIAPKDIRSTRVLSWQTGSLTDEQTTRLLGDLDRDTQARLLLANEFQTLACLHHPHVIRVLDYGFDDQQRPFFTMELLDPPTTILEAGRQPDVKLDGKVQFLIELLQALSYLHHHQIVHRDVKPSNVLVDHNGRVRVLDFGLAAKSSIEGVGYGGTLHYMSPEVMNSEPASEASDLYAVGVMAYELFAGRHPFNTSRAAALMRDVLTTLPDMMPVEEAAGDNLAQVIGRLLAKRPEDRYPDAQSVIRNIYLALNRETPAEDRLIRESFLQSAPLVGRREELRHLEIALENTLKGKGSAWLITGEAGIGKTRLIEEIRIRALVKGMLVLRGQSRSDKNLSGSLWRSVMQSLVISTSLTDSEASVLKAILPNIDELIERPIPDAPEVADQMGRLARVMANIFRRQTKPIVLILEDLHEDEANLLPLKELCRIVTNFPLMILGSYRSDDQRYFFSKFPDMRPLKLYRLSADEIIELTSAVLGDGGHDRELTNLLNMETEGNPLFIVEVLRTLADESGGLAAISRMRQPARILAHGMMDIMRRRLKRLPLDYQPMLRLAAVVGRDIDLTLLRHVDDELNYDQWLSVCNSAAILDYDDGLWRFSHDKLRDGILDGLDAAERQRLQRMVDEATAALYQQPVSAKAEPACPYPTCPDAGKVGGSNIIRYGKSAKGKQRFRCKTCRHTFTEDKTTSKPDARQVMIERSWVMVSEKAMDNEANQMVSMPAHAGN